MKKNGKYRTHPLVGGLLALSLAVTAATSAAAWAEWKYIEKSEREIRERYDMCALEAYVSMCEAIEDGDAETAADALSRCELYCGHGEFASLRARIMQNDIVDIDIDDADDVIAAVRDGGTATLIADVLRRADSAVGAAATGAGNVASVSSAGWETLRNKLDVKPDAALAVAREAVGGGALMHTSQSRSFPLVYAFTCKNGAAEVTKAGGRLLRMYVYRHGSAQKRGPDECRQAAVDFVDDAGIGECALTDEVYDGGEYRYTFCGAFYFGGHRVVVPDEVVTVTVDEDGASVCGFDASEYYRHRKMSYELPDELPQMPDGISVRNGLIYSNGELFWSESGGKIPNLTENEGQNRVQNP